jgi:hypothetical protein
MPLWSEKKCKILLKVALFLLKRPDRIAFACLAGLQAERRRREGNWFLIFVAAFDLLGELPQLSSGDIDVTCGCLGPGRTWRPGDDPGQRGRYPAATIASPTRQNSPKDPRRQMLSARLPRAR